MNVEISPEAERKLQLYFNLTIKWNRTINLVSKNDMSTLWHRHFMDSAQLLRVHPMVKGDWLDLGAGGGFPGMVLAIISGELYPNLRFTLVESDRRKAAFLRTVSRETSTPVVVHDCRIDTLEPMAADVVSARALAPLSTLLGYASIHMVAGGCAILPKGQNYLAELSEARKHWKFDVVQFKSETSDEAVILKMGSIERV